MLLWLLSLLPPSAALCVDKSENASERLAGARIIETAHFALGPTRRQEVDHDYVTLDAIAKSMIGGSLLQVISNPEVPTTAETSLVFRVAGAEVSRASDVLACRGRGNDRLERAEVARAIRAGDCQLKKRLVPADVASRGWLCLPSVDRPARRNGGTLNLMVGLVSANASNTVRVVTKPHFRSGSCAAAYASLPMRGWGLEQPHSLACSQPCADDDGAAAAAAAAAKETTFDVVVAAFSRAVAPMVAGIFGALPRRRRRRLWYYSKGKSVPKSVPCGGDLEALRALVDGRTSVAIETGLPNVGGCDHTYLLHIVRHYEDLGDTTLFLKDTTLAHQHLGSMVNVLAFSSRESRPSNWLAWCARRARASSAAFELPFYTSELCWRFGMRTCGGSRSSSYQHARVRPLGRWLEDHGILSNATLWTCRGGAFAASAAGIALTPRARYEAMLAELEDDSNNTSSSDSISKKKKKEKEKKNNNNNNNNVEAGHFVERAWFSGLFGAGRSWTRTERTKVVVYSGVFIGGTNGTDAKWLRDTLQRPPSRRARGSSFLPEFVFLSDSPIARRVAARKGWTARRSNGDDTTLRTAPHRLAALGAYDVSVFVEIGLRVDLEAIALAIAEDMVASSVAVSARRVCCGPRENHPVGLVRAALLRRPRQANALLPTLRAYARDRLLRHGSWEEAEGIASTSCVARRRTDAAALFSEAWLAETRASGGADALALHVLRSSSSNHFITLTSSPLVAAAPLRALPARESPVVPAERAIIRTWVFVATGNCSERWARLARRAVLSAEKYTTLARLCIFWGTPEDPLARWLEKRSRIVYHARPAWTRFVEEAVSLRGTQNARLHSPLYAASESLVATFLRIDVALMVNPAVSGDLVLYSDTDVLFRRDVTLEDFGGVVPEYFTMGAESDPEDTVSGNAGVMLLNLGGLRATYDDFVDFAFSRDNVDAGLFYGDAGPGDQGAFRAFYRGRFTVVPWPAFNWKAYWPPPPPPQNGNDVAIVHFHGPDKARGLLPPPPPRKIKHRRK